MRKVRADSVPNEREPGAAVLFAFDGSELARRAIEQGATQLASGREALVLCVWQPADVGFEPVSPRHFDANDATEVRLAAEETAALGASLLAERGFPAQSVTMEAIPTWKGIVGTAAQHQVGVIVIGSHRREGVLGHLGGSVAAAVVTHAPCSIFLVH
jgi:nucleotide-binding universal stress UspA family protein